MGCQIILSADQVCSMICRSRPFIYPNRARVYAVEWSLGGMNFYIDDKWVLYATPAFGGGAYTDSPTSWWTQCQKDNTCPPGTTDTAPFDWDHYIILNLAIGGDYTGNVTPDPAKLAVKPQEVWVDYVKVTNFTV